MNDEIIVSKKEAIQKICDSTIYGNLGLFVGTGLSMAVINETWDTIALSWKELLKKCTDELGLDFDQEIKTDGLSYPEIASQVADVLSKKKSISYEESVSKIKQKICELTCWFPVSEKRIKYGDLLEGLSPDYIITTNYDLVLECLLTGKCLSLGPDDQMISPKELIPIYHLHGIRTTPDSIVISQEDYISLFRPNQYRQQKLSLLLKESTTLIIGYSLGDINVLTAVDWSRNVYASSNANYPQDIIQLLFVENPNSFAYRDKNNILIIEFNSLEAILREICEAIEQARRTFEEQNHELDDLNSILENPSKENIVSFIDDKEFRDNVIISISKYPVKLISGVLELFVRSIDETWLRAKPYGAFEAYNENLIILLDILEKIPAKNIPPALFESVAYNLERLRYYISDLPGRSFYANNTWKKRKMYIPEETRKELISLARSRRYYQLIELLNES